MENVLRMIAKEKEMLISVQNGTKGEPIVLMDIQDQFGHAIDVSQIENQEHDLVRQYIKPDDVVLELGARYGSVSCTMNAKLTNRTHQVVVEPDERVWNALERNKRVNDCHFHIVKGFIARQKLSLTNPDVQGGSGSTFVPDPGSATPSFTLEQIQDMHGLTFNVLVADCEGFLEVFLDDNPNVYDTLRLLIFAADYREKCNQKITSALLAHGFYTKQEGLQNVWLKGYMPLRWSLPLRAKGFEMLSAAYGTPERFADVTANLRANLATQNGRVVVSNALCGSDPHHGRSKTLTIDCTVDGQRRQVQGLEGCCLYVGDDASTVISFMIRCRNAEATLERALTTVECLLRYGVRYEIVVVLHRCTDSSRSIAEHYMSVAPVSVRIVTYDHEVSRAGLETYVTDEDHASSFVAYSTWCLTHTRAPFVFKWDSDFEMNDAVAKEIAATLKDDQGVPLTVHIPTRFKDGQPAADEPWLSSAVVKYVKNVFWEVPIYLHNRITIKLQNEFLHNDSPRDPPKKYWDAEPWFSKEHVGVGNVFRRRFNMIQTLHTVPHDMARCGSTNLNVDLFHRLSTLKMSDLDELWMCDLKHIA
jgi:FkbM family methyltransferase